ncbi:MAG: preprotein translocase subunit SecY, partial [Bacteroidetes bacterium]|nr:preprotein translocase subunit SecY [Bacteroidota bacterium]
RILVTLGFIAIYRLGSFVVLPGVDPEGLESYTASAQDGIMGLINIFAGGAFARASVFALGIMPYISASIVIQLLGIAVPYFQKLQKEGESGRNKQNQITRYLTIIITAFQSVAFLANLKAQSEGAISAEMNPMVFMVVNVMLLTTGTLFVMWLGEKITDRGLGNGISLIIMIGIIARLPQAMLEEVANRLDAGGGLVILLLELIILLLVILAAVALVQAVRRIPVQYAKRVVGNKPMGGVRQYLPLKVNAAGVMPIIFAQALMFIPGTLAGLFTDSSDSANTITVAFNDITGLTYNLTFGVLIVLFTYFYTAVTINPTQIADDLKRNGGFVPGIRPGKETADHIDEVMSRITFPGSVFLAIIAVLPAGAMLFNISTQFAYFFGGTSLLIMVGVVLDTLQQIESHLLMKRYDGLLKTGRLKGRSSVGGAG